MIGIEPDDELDLNSINIDENDFQSCQSSAKIIDNNNETIILNLSTKNTKTSTKSNIIYSNNDQNNHMFKDRFGFWIDNDNDNFHQARLITEKEAIARKNKESERSKKWVYMMKSWDKFIIKQVNKLKSRIRKGIPDSLRTFAWSHLAEIGDIKVRYPHPECIDVSRLTDQVKDEVRIHIN